MKIQVVFEILTIFTQAAVGLLVQDPVVCRFTESNQCYVALGRRLHLQMPLEDEDGFNLKITDETNNTRFILKYRKTNSLPPKPNPPRWQFAIDYKTMILTSAERNDSGTYTLEIFNANGNIKGSYNLKLDTEGLLVQNAVVCRFTESYQCYVALGRRLRLQMPLEDEDGFDLKIIDQTNTPRLIFKYRKSYSNPPNPNPPRWQFDIDYKTMILTSAERNDTGTYTLDIYDGNGTNKGTYNLQLNTEGLLVQDPVVCRFTESYQCYVALGRRLHLQMPLEDEDGFNLKIIDQTNTPRIILKYRKSYSNPPKPNPPRWQFVIDYKTMILTSAERNDSGTYTLDIYDANGNNKGTYNLQLNTGDLDPL